VRHAFVLELGEAIVIDTVPPADGPATVGLLPSSSQLIEAFRGEYSAPSPCKLATSAAELAAHHLRQWAAEDESRNGDGPEAVARSKRRIDQLNARRVEMVAVVDECVGQQVPAVADVPLHTETLGSVVDRLAIAWVRSCRLRDSSAAGGVELARMAVHQLGELACAYDDLVRDVLAGRRRLPVWRPLKQYGAGR
jgi:hypothetical protein